MGSVPFSSSLKSDGGVGVMPRPRFYLRLNQSNA